MNEEGLIDVILHGPLAEKYGERHAFVIASPIEAVAALDANYPGFREDFLKTEFYYVHADGDWREGDDAAVATMPVGREVHFVPQIEGRAFLGPMLVGAVLAIPATSITAQVLGGLLVAGLLMGIGLLFKPKVKKPQRDRQKTDSYTFSGPENVTEQGVAVPLVYGRVYCGSVVISAGLEVNDEPTTSNGGEALPGGLPQSTGNAPTFPGGFPKIVGSGDKRHPNGWVQHTYDDEEKAWIWKPSPQPIPGWFYWYWTKDRSYSQPNGFFVTKAAV